MIQLIIKTLVSAVIIAAVSVISKKSSTFGAIVVSLPLTSILAMIWLFKDTKDPSKVLALSNSIVWIIVPSILFFIVLSLMLKKHCNFYLSMMISSVAMIAAYYVYVAVLKHFGISI